MSFVMANEFRDELKKLGNKQRFTFEGTFQKTGIKVVSTKSGKHISSREP